MPDLEPITREEKLWSGEDIEPITREEMYIKHIFDKTQTIPSKPITRKEMLLEKAGEGGGSDVTIKQLSVTENGTYSEENIAYSPVIVNVPKTPLSKLTVTENGTYTAPAGTGYDEVAVDVPLPSNAYLLKEVEGLPKDIATFTDGASLPMPSLKVGIEPIQEGSGDPSPSNVRPISGWTACNVVRTGKNLWDRDNIRRGVYTNGDGTTRSGSATTNFSSQFIKIMPNTTYSITMFGESYENGSLFGVYYDEYKNGLNQSTNILRLVSNESKTFTTPSNAHYVVFSGYRGAGTDIFTTANTMVCEGTPTTYEPYNGQTITLDLDGTRYGGKVDLVSGVMTVDRGYIASYNGETLPSTWISDRDVYAEGTTPTIGAEVCYELTTPLTIQLTPTQVKSLLGSNNVWADTGKIEELEYFSKEI